MDSKINNFKLHTSEKMKRKREQLSGQTRTGIEIEEKELLQLYYSGLDCCVIFIVS